MATDDTPALCTRAKTNLFNSSSEEGAKLRMEFARREMIKIADSLRSCRDGKVTIANVHEQVDRCRDQLERYLCKADEFIQVVGDPSKSEVVEADKKYLSKDIILLCDDVLSLNAHQLKDRGVPCRDQTVDKFSVGDMPSEVIPGRATVVDSELLNFSVSRPPSEIGSAISGCSSASTTARVRLAEQKAKAQAMLDVDERKRSLERRKRELEEMEMKSRHERQLVIEEEKRLENERLLKQVSYAEAELNRLDGLPSHSEVFSVTANAISQTSAGPKLTRIAGLPSVSAGELMPQVKEEGNIITRPRKVEYEIPRVPKKTEFENKFWGSMRENSPCTSYFQAISNNRSMFDGVESHGVSLKDDLSENRCTQRPVRYETERNEGCADGVERETLSDALRELTGGMAALQRRSALPSVEPPIFDGSRLEQYVPFRLAFTNLIESNCNHRSQLFQYLIQYTSGQAGEIVNSCFSSNLEIAYENAIYQLDLKYGSPHLLAAKYIDILNSWPLIKNEDIGELERLSLFLTRIKNMMSRGHEWQQLNHPAELRKIVEKLPTHMAYAWRDIAFQHHEEQKVLDFGSLEQFVRRQLEKHRLPIFGNLGRKNTKEDNKREPTTRRDPLKQSYTKPVFVTGVEQKNDVGCQTDVAIKNRTIDNACSNKNTDKVCWFCLREGHNLDRCRDFEGQNIGQRRTFLREKSLCFRCLKGGHMSDRCEEKVFCRRCNSNGHCQAMHASLQQLSVHAPEYRRSPDAKVYAAATTLEVMSPSVPIRVRFNGGLWINTYAALDTWASSNFLSSKLSAALGSRGRRQDVAVTTIMGDAQNVGCRVISHLEVQSIDGGNIYSLKPAYEISSWPFSEKDVPTLQDWKHDPNFQGLPFKVIKSNIGLLIGQANFNLLRSLEVVCGRSAFATRYKLGWALSGCARNKSSGEKCFRVSDESVIAGDLERLYRQEFEDPFPNQVGLSQDDKLWNSRVNGSIKSRADGKLEIALPFRADNPEIPCNMEQAVRSTSTLKRKLDTDSKLREDYVAFMNKLIDNGHLELVPEDEMVGEVGKVWFLVHHPVYHKVKRKLRVVFDCSRKFRGVSLNDALLTGPDLLNRLSGVLMRFREEEIAFAGDVEQMFMQLKVPKQHRDFMRILWWPNGQTSSKLQQYRLTSHTFGAVSSPSIANYAVKRAAMLAGAISAEARLALDRGAYMDDVLWSSRTVEEAIDTLKVVRDANKQVGFNLRDVVSNSRDLLRQLPGMAVSQNCRDVSFSGELPVDRVLGILWKVEGDNFGFNFNVKERFNQDCTKRTVLSTVSSIFDPLGFLIPVTVAARCLFQLVCSKDLDWDCRLTPELEKLWLGWVGTLGVLSDVKIPRCLKIHCSDVSGTELHVFCDGSEKAYAAVAYVRYVYGANEVSVSFLMSKARQVPIRGGALSTIPRIELNAARLAVSLGIEVRRESRQTFDREYFWSDSAVVLQYLRNEGKRFQRFVENRVNFILENSCRDSWRFVPGRENVADVASRGLSASNFIKCSSWFTGPKFLRAALIPEFPCPASNNFPLEVRTKVLFTAVNTDITFEKLLFSTGCWRKLVFRVGVFVEMLSYLRGGNANFPLSVEVKMQAECAILRFVQRKFFGSQIRCLKSRQALPVRDPLTKFSPFLDKESIMRMGGRLSYCEVDYESKYPIILPNHSPVVEILVRYVHRTSGHFGGQYLLARLREKYHIIGVTVLIKRIARTCVFCRKYSGRCEEPYMSNLPRERVEPVPEPFHATGIDYFGPFEVTMGRGRRKEKRYGVVFTCLASRAVHFEYACSLDTDSFLCAFRRFLARRGSVYTVFSDNGTNLVGSWRILREGLESMDKDKVVSYASQRGITWRFSPPCGSHFGGVWEREIRTARKVLSALLYEHGSRLEDEGFCTLLVEVEAIMNSRPLFPRVGDCPDGSPLTPNHILFAGKKASVVPYEPQECDLYMRKRWRYVQYLADLFWQRWRKEYLPTLKVRSKWSLKHSNVQVGDLVLVADGNLPRGIWPLAVIREIFPSRDGVVRRVKLTLSKTSNDQSCSTTVLERPVNKLIIVLKRDDLINN